MKQIIKQALYQMRIQPLLSAVIVIGTAMAICLVMVLMIVNQAKSAEYVPEVNRSRMLYVKYIRYLPDKTLKRASHSKLSLWLAKELFFKMETPESVTATYRDGEVLLGVPGKSEEKNAELLLTDANFWKVYEFNFIAGSAFSEAEHQSGIRKAVIVESVARRLFGDVDEAIGKSMQINFADYTVCGVVKDVHRFCELSFAEVYTSYNSNKAVSGTSSPQMQCTGGYVISILARRSSDFETIRQEVDKNLRLVNDMLKDSEVQLMGQPDDFSTQKSRKYSNQSSSMYVDILKNIIGISIILLVPAINLSGITYTRMRWKQAELGLRRAFGATRKNLLWLVLNENLVLTVIGGFIGLLLSYFSIWLMDDWLLQDSKGNVASMNSAMISPMVFFIAFTFCLVLNLLSAYIPARKVAHTPIVTSLNQKH